MTDTNEAKKFNGKEKFPFTVVQIYDTNIDKGRYELLIMNDEYAISSMFVLGTKKFNEQTKKYEDDEEYMNNAVQFLSEYGVTLDTIGNLEGREVELYVLQTKKGEVRVSTKKFKTFMEFEKPTISTEMYFKKNVSLPIKTLPITDNKNFGTFTLPFAIEKDGEEEFYKVSSIKKIVELPDGTFEQVKLSLKYESDKVKTDYDKKIEVTINDIAKESLIKIRDMKLAEHKANAIAKLNEFFGKDIYKIIEDEDTFDISEIAFLDWKMDKKEGKYIEVVLDI